MILVARQPSPPHFGLLHLQEWRISPKTDFQRHHTLCGDRQLKGFRESMSNLYGAASQPSSDIHSSFAKCGGIEDALSMTGTLSALDLHSWNALLSSSVDHETFDVYLRMKILGIEPDCYTYVRLFKACGNLKDVKRGRRLHVEVLHSERLMSDAFIQCTLLRMYGKCGATLEAESVFCGSAKRDIVSWNAMLSVYLERKEGKKALKLYRQLHEQKDVNVNELTFVIIVQVCCMLTQVDIGCSDGLLGYMIGQALHSDICRKKFAPNFFVASALLNMYKKMGYILDLERTFNALPQFDVVTCNVMISAYTEDGQVELALQFYRWMQIKGIHPDKRTYVFVLQACGKYAEEESSFFDGQILKKVPLEIGQALHIDASMRGFETSLFVENALLSMYGKCGAVREAEGVFHASCQHDVILCTVMMSVYVENGEATRALLLYRQLQHEDMTVDEQSLMFALQACAVLAGKEEISSLEHWRSKKFIAFEIGRSLHADIHRKGFIRDAFLANSLINMYGKSGAILQAEDAFNAFSNHDIALWNTLLLAYLEQNKGARTLQLYRQMQIQGVIPDQVTYCISLMACTIIEERDGNGLPLRKFFCLEIGAALHCDICRQGFSSDVSVGIALIRMYGSFGMILETEYLLDLHPYPTFALWSAMLSVYTESNQGEKALELYKEIHEKFGFFDELTVIRILQACSLTGCLRICKSIHFYVVSSSCDQIQSVVATVIHTYGNCASIVDGQAVWDEVIELDIAIWNAFISCHADSSNVADILESLRQESIEPDDVTFTTILILCCHQGFVRNGIECFECMWRDFDVNPSIMHYCAITDLFGRTGNFNGMENILNGMPMQANTVIWSSVLSACRLHGNSDLAKEVFNKAKNLKSELPSLYVLLSNIYVEIGVHV